jgi:hypothetical protein
MSWLAEKLSCSWHTHSSKATRPGGLFVWRLDLFICSVFASLDLSIGSFALKWGESGFGIDATERSLRAQVARQSSLSQAQ